MPHTLPQGSRVMPATQEPLRPPAPAVLKSSAHGRLSASLERASRGPLTQVATSTRQAVLDSIQCIICLDVVQLPVSITCFQGCPGTHARANNTCLRGMLCQHCANDTLQLNRPPAERFVEERGRVRCMICRQTAVDSRQLTPVKAYTVNHPLMDVMDAIDIGATCRKCEEDFPTQAALQAHYQKHCPHAVVQCRFKGCPQVGLRPLVDAHQEACSVGRAVCQQCKERVDKDELVYHMVANCRMRVVVCVLCSHRARLPDMLLHLRLHQAQLQLQLLQKGSTPAAAASVASRSRQAAAALQSPQGMRGELPLAAVRQQTHAQQQQAPQHQHTSTGATSQAVAVALRAGAMRSAPGGGSFPAASTSGLTAALGVLASNQRPQSASGSQTLPSPSSLGHVSAAVASTMASPRPGSLPTTLLGVAASHAQSRGPDMANAAAGDGTSSLIDPQVAANGRLAAAGVAAPEAALTPPALQMQGTSSTAMAAASAPGISSMNTMNGSVMGGWAQPPVVDLSLDMPSAAPATASQHRQQASRQGASGLQYGGQAEGLSAAAASRQGAAAGGSAGAVTLLPGSMLHANQHQMLYDMLQRLRRRHQQQVQQQRLQQLQQQLLQRQQQMVANASLAPAAVSQLEQAAQQAQLQPQLPRQVPQAHQQEQRQERIQPPSAIQAPRIQGEWPEYQLSPPQRDRLAYLYPPPAPVVADAGAVLTPLPAVPAAAAAAEPLSEPSAVHDTRRGEAQPGVATAVAAEGPPWAHAQSEEHQQQLQQLQWQQQQQQSGMELTGRLSDRQATQRDSGSSSSATSTLAGVMQGFGAELLHTLSDALTGSSTPTQRISASQTDVPMLVTISPAIFRHRSSDFIGYESERASGRSAQRMLRMGHIESDNSGDGSDSNPDIGAESGAEDDGFIGVAWARANTQAQAQGSTEAEMQGDPDGGARDDNDGTRDNSDRSSLAAAELELSELQAAVIAASGSDAHQVLTSEGLHLQLPGHAARHSRQRRTGRSSTGLSVAPSGDAVEGIASAVYPPEERAGQGTGGWVSQHGTRSWRARSMQHRQLAMLRAEGGSCGGGVTSPWAGSGSAGGSPLNAGSPYRRRAGSMDVQGPRRRRLSDSEAVQASRQELALASQAVAAMLLCPAAD